ncbi:uncharacterized protein LOC111485653 [Cucurbita maxima]|uniref:Uncharacterized protein LOC111485653 n=1 Tax=Cucurbita maxima TaxID=3661 RepID=A0A6J1JJG1_CUCMA|nr:uncharacterized protein LOC111485653 [Cucurbita maxima]
MEAEEGPTHLSPSPTFSIYSSGSCCLAEIAATAVREIGEEPFADADNYGWESQGSVYRFRENMSNSHARESAEGVRSDDCGKNGYDDEFKFVVLCREPDAVTSSAHEIFYNGQIMPVYPVFNMDSLLDNGSRVGTVLENLKKSTVHRSPLRNMMNEEECKTTSVSSSGADGLAGVPPDTYCVWSPSAEKTLPEKKHKGIELLNRWKFRDLIYNHIRSKSEGVDALTMRTAIIKKDDRPGNVPKMKKDDSRRLSTSSSSPNFGTTSFPAQSVRYGWNRTVKEAEKRRSYLYRQHWLVLNLKCSLSGENEGGSIFQVSFYLTFGF